MLDVSTLTKNQRYAFLFTEMAMRKGITWSLLRQVIKEVLFWGEGDKIMGIEIKFIRGRQDIVKFRQLWGQGGPAM